VRTILRLENPIRDYAWGSRTAIAGMLGEPAPAAGPQAELWMGAHPAAPSQVWLAGQRLSLAELVAREPEAILGRSVAARFGARLPFLVKLLAAAEPLSIQAHPDAEQARAGFARENALAIPIDSERRSYRDASHKPELFCALEPFEALRGFRAPDEIRALAERLGVRGVSQLVGAALEGPAPLAALTGALLRLDPEHCAALVAEAAGAAAAASDPGLAWIPRLAARHPRDAGSLAPLFLRYLCLAPGEAIFLAPGELHGYLGGFGIEVMASSDNVVRGGLTAKHVDLDELLRVVRFEPASAEVLRPESRPDGTACFRTPAEEFELSVLRVGPGRSFASQAERGVELLLCTRGGVRVAAREHAEDLAPGRSCLAPAAAGAYSVTGEGELYRVRVAAMRERASGAA
jgi:mannose-6-phosphate isomerase